MITYIYIIQLLTDSLRHASEKRAKCHKNWKCHLNCQWFIHSVFILFGWLCFMPSALRQTEWTFHDYYRVTLCIFNFQFFDVKRFASHVMLKIRGDVNLLKLWAEYWRSFLPWYPSCNDSLEWPSAASPGESLVLSFQSWDACVEDQTQRALIVQRRVAGKWDQYTVNEHVNGTLPEKAYATNYCIY